MTSSSVIGSAWSRISETGCGVAEREAEVALHEAADPAPVLLRVGAGEPELLARLLLDLLASPTGRRRARTSMMSPGSSRTIRKMMIEIPISVGIATRMRLRTYPPTA